MMHVEGILSTLGDIMRTSGGTILHVGDSHGYSGGYYGYIFGYSAQRGFQYKFQKALINYLPQMYCDITQCTHGISAMY